MDCRILLIDDERFVVESLRLLIQKALPVPVEVDVAVTGNDGFDAATFTPYDLIVMDLKMPHLGGIQLIDMIRMVQPDVRFIIYSACTEEYEEELREIKVEAIMRKPAPIHTVIETIAKALKVDLPEKLEA